MVQKKYKILKNEIIKVLKSKNIYNDVDTSLIDQLIFNYQLLHKVQKELLTGEYMVNVRNNADQKPLYQVTPNYTVYQNTLKNIIAISRSLAITPQEQNKLKTIADTNENDGF
jgi:P27 family predicted phage terminase small subunit